MKRIKSSIALLFILCLMVPSILTGCGDRSKQETPSTTKPVAATKPMETTAPQVSPANVSSMQWVAKEIVFKSSKQYHDHAPKNITLNQDFEKGQIPPNWSAVNGGAIDISSDRTHSGSNALRLALRTKSDQSPAFNVYDFIKQNKAGSYQIGFWVCVDKLPEEEQPIRLLLKGSGNKSSIVLDQGTVTAKSWAYFSGTVSVTDADLKKEKDTWNVFVDSIGATKKQNLYIDDLYISKVSNITLFQNTEMDVIFKGPDGTAMTMPAFWDGGTTWKVRFAPTKVGTWTYQTVCTDKENKGLNNQTGTLQCTPYTGTLPIYKHGFVKISGNNRYFTYADGTPFFYLGDTHWIMPHEKFYTSNMKGVNSQFKYIVDKRIKQGFTVYQSEPIQAYHGGVDDPIYDLTNGITQDDIAGFHNLDRKFQYVADQGLLHTNAQLVFASELANACYTKSYLEKLSRYWVARYAAYPVLWTTGQEVDRGLYAQYDADTNPWKTVAQAVYRYDPYKHPATAHQEGTSFTKSSNSAFKDLTSHKWFGVQWSTDKQAPIDFSVVEDYWNAETPKPAVNYEGFYEGFWTDRKGTRIQAWTTYLNGMCGYGYGAAGIWNDIYYYKNSADNDCGTAYEMDKPERQIDWREGVNYEGADDMMRLKSCLGNLSWWELTPHFDDEKWFKNDTLWFNTGGSWYSLASKGNELYVAYFYNNTLRTGTIKNLENTRYLVQWYNPATGKYVASFHTVITDGTYEIGNKPGTEDWVLILKKG